MKYDNLFSKGNIGSLEIKNRLVMPAMGTSLASFSGEASDEIIKYYEERAKGGVGLIITEITRIDEETGIGSPNQLSVTDFKHIPRLEKLARTIHKYDAKIFVQLHHPGRQNHSHLLKGKQITAPSEVMSKAIGEMPRAFSTEEVEALVKKFVFGATISKMAGIDGVEIHAAHGYLVGQFLSPLTNLRTDKYGGNFENRMRFLTEIIIGIKNSCGNSFPISVRIDGDEFVPGGINLDEAVKTAVELEALGVDVINVSAGTYESVNAIIEPISYPQGWKKHLAASIKNAVKIPVIACDVIRKPDFAENLLKEGNVDFVALGRQLLADPEWLNKAKDGKENQIRPCISCLHCIESVMKYNTIKCAVNARTGKELEFSSLCKNGQDRVVAIIGGGPSGMEAARVLALKGFKPVIFEKENTLGGNLNLANKPPLKEKITWLIDSLLEEMSILNIDIRFNTVPTIEDLKALNPYAVFIASGSLPIIPNIPGINNSNVYTIQDILEGSVNLECNTITIIGSGMTGLETAEFLASKGKKVTIVEMQDKIGPDMYLPNLIDITTRLKKYNVNMLPSTKLISIQENNITVLNTKTNDKFNINTDSIILSLGIRPNNSFKKDLEENFSLVKVIGDASKPSKIANAIETAFVTSYMLR